MCIRNGSRGTNDIFSYKCICKVEEVIVVYCLKSISMFITACNYFVCGSCLKGRYIQRILPIITNINNLFALQCNHLLINLAMLLLLMLILAESRLSLSLTPVRLALMHFHYWRQLFIETNFSTMWK